MCIGTLSGPGAELVAFGTVLEPYGKGRIKFASRPPVANENELMRKFMPMISRLAARAAVRQPHKSYDDILSDATLRALAAVRTFDPRKGMKLTTFVYAAVQKRSRVKWNPLRNATELGEVSVMEDRQERAPDAKLVRRELRQMVRDAVRKIPNRHQRRVLTRFLRKLSAQEIATELGISTASVSWHRRRGLKALRAIMEPSGCTDSGA